MNLNDFGDFGDMLADAVQEKVNDVLEEGAFSSSVQEGLTQAVIDVLARSVSMERDVIDALRLDRWLQNYLAENGDVRSIDMDEVWSNIQDVMGSLPHDESGRCDLGRAFTRAVRVILEDHGTVERIVDGLETEQAARIVSLGLGGEGLAEMVQSLVTATLEQGLTVNLTSSQQRKLDQLSSDFAEVVVQGLPTMVAREVGRVLRGEMPPDPGAEALSLQARVENLVQVMVDEGRFPQGSNQSSGAVRETVQALDRAMRVIEERQGTSLDRLRTDLDNNSRFIGNLERQATDLEAARQGQTQAISALIQRVNRLDRMVEAQQRFMDRLFQSDAVVQVMPAGAIREFMDTMNTIAADSPRDQG